MLPNPWVLLGAFAVWASTLVGCWFYKGNIDTQEAKANLEAVQLADGKATAKFLADAKAKADEKLALTERNRDDLQKKLDREHADLLAERDVHQRLLSAVEIYANAGSVGAGLSAASEIALLGKRLETLGQLYSDLDSAGEQAAADADAVNDHLAACEATVGK